MVISAEQPDEAAVAPTFRVMNLGSVQYHLGDSAPELALIEADAPYRSLTIQVALSDAQAIFNAAEGRSMPRPSTHELFVQALREMQSDVIASRIVRHVHGVFYAELDIMTPRGRVVLDARVSDAVTLALRQRVPAPLLCADDVLAEFNEV